MTTTLETLRDINDDLEKGYPSYAEEKLEKLIVELEANEPTPPFGTKRKAAMAVYTPPFRFQSGYIFDSRNHVVSDDGPIGDGTEGVEGAVAARVRGWGRIGYMPNAAALQDEIGQMMADALNAYYKVNKEQT